MENLNGCFNSGKKLCKKMKASKNATLKPDAICTDKIKKAPVQIKLVKPLCCEQASFIKLIIWIVVASSNLSCSAG